MSAEGNSLEEEVLKVTQRLALRHARVLLKQDQAAIQQRSRDRRHAEQLSLELGRAIYSCGVDACEPALLIGALLDGCDRAAESATLRLALKKRGETVFSKLTKKAKRILLSKGQEPASPSTSLYPSESKRPPSKSSASTAQKNARADRTGPLDDLGTVVL